MQAPSFRRPRQAIPRALALLIAVGALVTLLPPSSPARAAEPLDFEIPGGHFYKQANGRGGQGDLGYAVTNEDGIPFWDEFQRVGGVAAVGYPASRRFVWDGFTVQVMQKVVFQWHPDARRVMFVNLLDRMHELAKDPWLAAYRQTPPPFDTSPDTGLPWEQVVRRHWAFLDRNPAIKARYFADPAALDHYGLPMSYGDFGNSFVIRAQRAVFQYWKEDVPWARRGEVTIANGGDLGKEAELFPTAAVTPELPTRGSSGGSSLPSHDWRSPGYVAAIDGTLYDGRCVPLRSVGANVPNLPYRDGLEGNLAWLRQHQVRWLRVFATGHSLGPDRAPRDAASAGRALRQLLDVVEADNARHDPAEAIYVLVALTDYYPPGVPGDRHAFDHPTFTDSPVLPAPWFRAGVPYFDFEQEHEAGRVTGLPSYEVNYKPWVRALVSGLADHPALLGWQLGNELKARGSPRNGITSAQAYDWYLAFTRDMVDTIREIDRNHLIFTGAQYIAELVDWEYRPKGALDPSRVPEYRRLAERMLANAGRYTWNVWSLTLYDFNPYALDDASLFSRAGATVVATEYGFTRGTPDEMRARFGGDRAAAVRSGMAATWESYDGQAQGRYPAAAELVASGQLAGIAPWGSPAPDVWSGFDEDPIRGVTGAPDESALWTAWRDVGAGLASADRAAGPAAACLDLNSPAR